MSTFLRDRSTSVPGASPQEDSPARRRARMRPAMSSPDARRRQRPLSVDRTMMKLRAAGSVRTLNSINTCRDSAPLNPAPGNGNGRVGN